MGSIESTYKARDVEEIVDIYIYRPWGYAIAKLALRLKMTPNHLSIIGMFIGVLGGHFFFYDNLTLNLIGIVCWMFGQAFDGADGQLARMANMQTRMGRILDGASDSIKFISVYIHIGLRLAIDSGSWWVFLIVAVTAYSHSFQSSLADFYRQAYLFFVVNPKKAEIDKAQTMIDEYNELRWTQNFWEKFFMWWYVIYTKRQERWSGGSVALQRLARNHFGADIFPEWLRSEYRRINRPLLKYYNALSTNTRMIVFYICLFINNLYIFVFVDLVVLNILMFLMAFVVQIRADKIITNVIERSTDVPA